jgi:hypothetical protein
MKGRKKRTSELSEEGEDGHEEPVHAQPVQGPATDGPALDPLTQLFSVTHQPHELRCVQELQLVDELHCAAARQTKAARKTARMLRSPAAQSQMLIGGMI